MTMDMSARCSLAVAFTACAAVATGADSIVGLSVDHMTEPGDRGGTPSFAWRMESARPGAAQGVYRIKVAAGDADGGLVWDSGEVADGRSVAIRYAGDPLKSASRYVWTVSAKNERGEWMKPATGVFTTGFFGADDWNGSKWISAVDSKVSEYPSDTDVQIGRAHV